MNSSIMGVVVGVLLITTFCLATPLVWAADTVLFEEDFEDVPLESSIMEEVKDNKVWSGTPPEDWENYKREPQRPRYA